MTTDLRGLDRRASIIICIFFILVGCQGGEQRKSDISSDHQADSSSRQSASDDLITVALDADPTEDLRAAIEAGDFRFVGVFGYAVTVPSVPDFFEKFGKTHGIKVIEGTSDSFDDSTSMANDLVFRKYAARYNRELLKYLEEYSQ